MAKVAKNSEKKQRGGSKKGERRGGRQKGTPNKKSQALQDSVAEKYPGYNPIFSLIEMALDDETPIELKFACHKEVAKYVVPQLKAIDVVFDSKDNRPIIEDNI